MKLLETFKQLLSFAFVQRKSTKESSAILEHPFEFKNSLALFVFTFNLVLIVYTFFVNVIETPQEIFWNIYAALSLASDILNFTFLFWNRQKLFAFIDDLEREIGKRELWV